MVWKLSSIGSDMLWKLSCLLSGADLVWKLSSSGSDTLRKLSFCFSRSDMLQKLSFRKSKLDLLRKSITGSDMLQELPSCISGADLLMKLPSCIPGSDILQKMFYISGPDLQWILPSVVFYESDALKKLSFHVSGSVTQAKLSPCILGSEVLRLPEIKKAEVEKKKKISN